MAGAVLVLESDLAADIRFAVQEDNGALYELEAWDHEGSGRWSQLYQFVIKRTKDGSVTYWSTTIERGSTEYQDTGTFQDEEFIEFVQVDRIPTVTYNYVKIK